MKLHKRLLLGCSGLLLLAIAGCGFSQTPTVFSTSPISSIEPTTVAVSTLTPAMPKQTSTVVVIPSATIATIAVIPTLETDQAYNFLQQLVEGNPACRLPCWGEVRPGITSNTQAETLLQPLSTLIYGGPFYQYKGKEFSGPGGGRNFLFGDTQIRFDFNWFTERDKNTVEMLRISADALSNDSERMYGTKPYNQIFEQYSLHNILSQHGVPSQTWTFADVYYYGNDQPNPSLPEEFRILLFYDKGVFIKYTMPLQRIGDGKGKACPSEAFFDLGLVAPEASEFYQIMWFAFATGSQDFTYYEPIESATQMTFDEFYQAFRESNTPCFEIPLTIWPKR